MSRFRQCQNRNENPKLNTTYKGNLLYKGENFTCKEILNIEGLKTPMNNDANMSKQNKSKNKSVNEVINSTEEID